MKVVTDLGAAVVRGSSIALGFFDGLHIGHQAVLAAAAKNGPLALFTFLEDAPFRRAPMILTEGDKRRTAELLGVEMYICPPFSAIRDIPPEVFFRDLLAGHFGAVSLSCGVDYRFGAGASGDAPMLRSLAEGAGMAFSAIEKVMRGGAPVSSTRIRQAISRGEMGEATALLGRDYAIRFPVARGREVGRAIGFPTANQEYPEGLLLPRFGVYETEAGIGGERYRAITNVGCRPTVGAARPLAETHIPGFSGDLYGRPLPLAFKRFIRPERKFSSIEALRAQIARDVAQVAGR